MQTLISVLLLIITGLSFFLFRKSEQNKTLKAEKDLTNQANSSKIVDSEIADAQGKIDQLESELKIEDDEEGFWDDYTKKK